MSDPQTAAAGAAGGAAAEIGSEYRARVGALLAVAVLRRSGVTDLGFPSDTDAPAVLLQAESDDPVDDLVLRTAGGTSVYLQAKHTATLSTKAASPFGAAVDQFARAVARG